MATPERVVVYYSGGLEDPTFEALICAHLAQTCPWPIVSVTQTPLDLGHNICVGRQHPCDANAFRQLVIGAEATTAPYIMVAESDVLYPPEYWHMPTPDTVRRYTPVMVLWRGKPGLRAKEWTEGAQIIERQHLLACYARVLAGRPLWSSPGDSKPGNAFRKRSWSTTVGTAPVITIKTGNGLRAFTGTIRGRDPVSVVPYWGDEQDIRNLVWPKRR